MDLFNNSPNILPFDGEVNYYGPVIGIEKAQSYMEELLQDIVWDNDKAIIFGKEIIIILIFNLSKERILQ